MASVVASGASSAICGDSLATATSAAGGTLGILIPPSVLLAVHGISPMMVILTIVVIYVVLGCVLESMSMMLLTVPVFFPVMQGLGFDLIWFGILVVILIEVSLITPPVGMNVFVLRAVIPDVSAVTIFKGILPFFMVDLLRIVVVIAFPAVVTFLPRLL